MFATSLNLICKLCHHFHPHATRRPHCFVVSKPGRSGGCFFPGRPGGFMRVRRQQHTRITEPALATMVLAIVTHPHASLQTPAQVRPAPPPRPLTRPRAVLCTAPRFGRSRTFHSLCTRFGCVRVLAGNPLFVGRAACLLNSSSGCMCKDFL